MRIDFGKSVYSDWGCYRKNKKEFYPNAKIVNSMSKAKDIDDAFDKVEDFDFYEAFTQNELIYISQAMEAYSIQWANKAMQAASQLSEARAEIERLKGLLKEGFVLVQQQYGKSLGQIDRDWQKFKLENKL